MDISNIINGVLFRYPLFGNIIVNLEIKYTNQNVCAPAFTDGKAIYYKNEFLTDYDDDEKEFIIAHEIFHIVLSHLFRNIGRDPDLLNYVEDAIINQLLIKDGLKMPKGLVYVEDALDYSVEELYMKLLPRIKEIKEWMGANTYHIDLSELSEIIQDLMSELHDKDLQSLMYDNKEKKDEAMGKYKIELEIMAEKLKSQTFQSGSGSSGIEFPAMAVGTAKPLLRWQDILKENLKVPDEDSTSFYEVQMDGIIKKETSYEDKNSESEIIIDSSGSMEMDIIKVILRECKNILLYSDIKAGFCDDTFYGWHDIRTNNDIDELKIIGRGGTDFYVMADSFSTDIDNKIIITDGEDRFPHRPDILWIIIGKDKPPFLNKYYGKYYLEDTDINSINYIFIDEKDIMSKENYNKLVLRK